jgi:hypothetical protein
VTEDQIFKLVCEGAMGHKVFWHGSHGWREIYTISDKEVGDEWPAKISGGKPDDYIDLYNVDIDDLMVVVEMNIDWENVPKAEWVR